MGKATRRIKLRGADKNADGETRTRTAKPHAPQACVSTNSTTSAWEGYGAQRDCKNRLIKIAQIGAFSMAKSERLSLSVALAGALGERCSDLTTSLSAV